MLPFSFCRRRFNYATDRRTMTSSQSSSSSSLTMRRQNTSFLFHLQFVIIIVIAPSFLFPVPHFSCHSESIYTRAKAHRTPATHTQVVIQVYRFSYSSHQLPQTGERFVRSIFSFCFCHWQWHISILFIYLFSRFPIIVASRFVSITIKGEHIYTRVAV